MAEAVNSASARLASDQLEHLLALRTAGLDHMREAFRTLAQQSTSKDLRLRELEQTVAELRAADRAKNDTMTQVEVEITEMRSQMQQAKRHYEQLIKQVEDNAQRSVLSAQQNVAEMRTTLEATLVENTSLKARIDKLKRKHGEQMEQLAIRQKQEMFIANAQFRASEQRGGGRGGGGAYAGDSGTRALGDLPH